MVLAFYCEGLALQSSAAQQSRGRGISVSSCVLGIDSRFDPRVKHRLLVSDGHHGNGGEFCKGFKGDDKP